MFFQNPKCEDRENMAEATVLKGTAENCFRIGGGRQRTYLISARNLKRGK